MDNNCSNIITNQDSEDIINARFWKKVGLCAEFSDYKNYFSISKASFNSSCPNNNPYNCGIVDTLNNSLCVDNVAKCPINYFSLVSRYNNLILKPEYTNSYDEGKIFTSFKVLDSKPCLNGDEIEGNELTTYNVP